MFIEKTGPAFKRAFIFLKASKEALKWCQPLLALDGCHIRNVVGGVILAAVSYDGAKQLVPIAFAVCDIEDEANWDWFLSNLKANSSALNSATCSFTIISDRAKGLINAVSKHFPSLEHGYCAKHIERNLLKSYGQQLKTQFWIASRAYSKDVYNHSMHEIRLLNSAGYDYLKRIDPKFWTLSAAPTPRFGTLTSNISESFNSWISKARSQSHFGIFVAIFQQVQNMFYDRHQENLAIVSPLPMKLMKKLSTTIAAGRGHQVLGISSKQAIVKDNKTQYAICLQSLTCQCKEFDDMQFPCSHAAAVATETNHDVLSFVHNTYQTASMQKVYACEVIPVATDKLPTIKINAPVITKKAGRPRTSRIKSSGEKLPGKGHCSICKVQGHNKRRCLNK